ncbi:hypothetical protein EV424DRAFT_1354902 [Suillus variegatus]|nr:hypothetical protein EV424DRAFT_1354902 [Suillus variegatus]
MYGLDSTWTTRQGKGLPPDTVSATNTGDLGTTEGTSRGSDVNLKTFVRSFCCPTRHRKVRTLEDRIMFEEIITEATALINKGIQDVWSQAFAFQYLLTLDVLFKSSHIMEATALINKGIQDSGHIVGLAFTTRLVICLKDVGFNPQPRLAHIEAGGKPVLHNISTCCYNTWSSTAKTMVINGAEDRVSFHKQAEVAYALWGDNSSYRQKVRY